MSRRKALVLIGVVLMLGVLTGRAQAFQTLIDETVYVAPDKTLAGSYLLVGQTVRVEGTLDGDVLIFAQSARINGEIKGDIIGAGSKIEVNGPVRGDIRVAAREVILRAPVDGSFSGAAETIYIEKGVRIGRDVVFAADRFNLDGEVGRHISATGNEIYLDGRINGNTRLVEIGSLKLGDSAHIAGDLKYSSPDRAIKAEGAVVEGTQKWTKKEREKDQPYAPYLNVAAGFLGLLLVWWVFRAVSPPLWEGLATEITTRPWRTLALGAAAFLAVPGVVLLLLFTVVGIPLALILGGLYTVLIYISKIIIAVTLGKIIGQISGWQETIPPFWLYLLGLSLVMLLTRIPQFGFIIAILIVWWGMGAAFSQFLARKLS